MPTTSETAEARANRLERQLAATERITHIGSWEWDPATNVVHWSDELFRIYGLEPRSRVITFEVFASMLHPDDRARVQAEVGRALEQGGAFAYVERIVRPDGSLRWLESAGEATRGEEGKISGLIGTCRDVTDERQRTETISIEKRVLEAVAAGEPLEDVLTELVLAIEGQLPGTIASILLLDETGTRLRHGAAPNLTASYNAAIDGLPIGLNAGSCGTAAFLRQPVYVRDVMTDPRWVDYTDLARTAGFRACWSTPILGSDGRVLGTFALYDREPRLPQDADLALIARVTHVAGIAIQRRQLDDQLRALSGRIEAAREEERAGIAREIHDELGQSLTALKLDLAWIARRLGKEELDRAALEARIAAMLPMIDGVIDQVRRISSELRPGVLDDLGLYAAIEWQAQAFEDRTGIPCVVQANGAGPEPTRAAATVAFRIFQEALTNVARHASASHVDVAVESGEVGLRLTVVDDGTGIGDGALNDPRSLGLLGMRERARRLGGTAIVRSHETAGTVVDLEIPHQGERP